MNGQILTDSVGEGMGSLYIEVDKVLIRPIQCKFCKRSNKRVRLTFRPFSAKNLLICFLSFFCFCFCHELLSCFIFFYFCA